MRCALAFLPLQFGPIIHFIDLKEARQQQIKIRERTEEKNELALCCWRRWFERKEKCTGSPHRTASGRWTDIRQRLASNQNVILFVRCCCHCHSRISHSLPSFSFSYKRIRYVAGAGATRTGARSINSTNTKTKKCTAAEQSQSCCVCGFLLHFFSAHFLSLPCPAVLTQFCALCALSLPLSLSLAIACLLNVVEHNLS